MECIGAFVCSHERGCWGCGHDVAFNVLRWMFISRTQRDRAARIAFAELWCSGKNRYVDVVGDEDRGSRVALLELSFPVTAQRGWSLRRRELASRPPGIICGLKDRCLHAGFHSDRNLAIQP